LIEKCSGMNLMFILNDILTKNQLVLRKPIML